MLRVWCENLTYAEARSRPALELLESGPLHPLFATRHDADLDELARTLRAARARSLEVGVWPLLDDARGYWPSERNAAHYVARVDALLDELDARQIPPDWIAVDLEPPLGQVDRLRHDPGLAVAEVVALARENYDPDRFERSRQIFEAAARRWHRRGVRTLGVTLPLAAHDLRDGVPLWQDLFETPWAHVPWSRAGIMAYGSMVAGYSGGQLDLRDVRALHHRLFVRLARALGPRAHASLGVTGAGKLGDEPSYRAPDEIAADVAAARAAGVDDLAIFCLRGLLARPDAGAWVDAIRRAGPDAPTQTPRSRLIRLGGASVRALLKGVLRS
jgi:hypothetical protein